MIKYVSRVRKKIYEYVSKEGISKLKFVIMLIVIRSRKIIFKTLSYHHKRKKYTFYL